MDIVFVDKNEKEFLEISSKLGISDLVFVNSDSVYSGLLVDSKNISKRLGRDLVFFENPSRSDYNKNVDVVYNLEVSSRPDFIHHRNSGLNHVLAKMLSDKDIIVAFNFGLFFSNKYASVIGRMKQNVKLCRKYKVKMIVGSFAKEPYFLRSSSELKAFASLIGFTGSEIKKMDSVILDKINFNRKKLSGKILADGAELV